MLIFPSSLTIHAPFCRVLAVAGLLGSALAGVRAMEDSRQAATAAEGFAAPDAGGTPSPPNLDLAALESLAEHRALARETRTDRPVDAIDVEIARIEKERRLLAAQAALAQAKLADEHRSRREALEREALEIEERKQRLERLALERQESLEQDIRGLRDQGERLGAEKELAATRAELALGELKLEESRAKSALSRLTLEIANHDKTVASRLFADGQPLYLDDPLDGDTLVISDRRIPLNGVITAETATDVSARIQFYNNSDPAKPIFIVIDDCPGGSVMAGYHILEAMDGSAAPVYVVVKQFAASMAACITTLADRSFAYPNAILLHHQISSGLRGNLTQQREGLEAIEEWWRRLAAPVAAKMGITTDEFIGQMYDKVSTGDWAEFADDARELKWVDHVVGQIRETGQLRHPDAPETTATPRPGLPPRHGDAPRAGGTDPDGRPFLLLPRPNPIDKYYLHNPDGYFRFP